MELNAFVPVLFLVSGFILFAVSFYLRRQSRQLQTAISQLYDINKQVEQDVLDFLEKSWPVMMSAGFSGLKGQVSWFGEHKPFDQGSIQEKSFQIEISEENIQVSLTVYASTRQAEGGLLELVFKTFEMLMISNVSNKTNQFLVSQKRLEKFQVFVQHDMKNVAQFVALLESQIGMATSDQDKVVFCDRLSHLLPSMVQRAKKVSEPLTFQSQTFDDVDRISLEALLESLSKTADFSCDIQGKLSVFQSKRLLNQVFENIIDNFQAHLREANQLHVDIKQNQQDAEVNIYVKGSSLPKLLPERAFEPFWTTSHSGMGLGLFIVRALLEKINGTIILNQEENCFGFSIVFPVENAPFCGLKP